ncbi:uncharacterized protein [Mytilus edulis]|uniref:uncharacterized protein n=1 Tax=Mytilus edulis TaxID=6550 RepID=UPI0039F11F8F
MITVSIFLAITVHLQIVSGVLNDIVPIMAHRGEKVVLRCSSSGTEKSWFGPDLNDSAHESTLMYFSNHLKNPKLNLFNYFVQANEGNYDLTIFSFQKGDIGLYRCKFLNNRTFDETKYNVSLLDDVVETSKDYEDRKNLENTPGIQVNVKETSSQLSPRLSKPDSTLTITFIVVFLLVISLKIIGVAAQRKWGYLGKRMNSLVVSFRKDAERITLADDITEQPGLIDEPVEPTDGLHYLEVLMEPRTPTQARIRGIENRIMYSEIDHSLKA